MLSAFAIVICLFASVRASAFPAAPVPLYRLWEGSEYVVYADVHAVTEQWGKQRATLSIAKVLKGDPQKISSSISVFASHGGCPYPHNFEANERVLIFLVYDPHELMFKPVASSEAVIPMDVDQLRKFEAALRQLPDIFEETDEGKRKEKLLRWSIDCALEPATRSEGVHAIHCLRPQNVSIKRFLSEADVHLLLQNILKENPPTESVRGLVSLLRAYPSIELDDLLLRSLQQSSDDHWQAISRIAIQDLPDRLHVTLTQETQKRVDAFFDRETQAIVSELDPQDALSVAKSNDIEWGWLCCQVWNECKDKVVAAK